MNWKHLKGLLNQRNTEIGEGLNLATFPPVYVVLSLVECVAFGHVEISSGTNRKGWDCEEGYFDRDDTETGFHKTADGLSSPEEVTRFWIDCPDAFFITRKGAEEYLKYQSHNLANAYLYVFHTGYANHEMNELFK